MTMAMFGVACMCVYAINAWANAETRNRYADALGASVLLCIGYGMSNLLVGLYGFPEAVLAFPVLDMALLFLVARAARKNMEPWKLIIALLLVFQLAIHASFIGRWHIEGIEYDDLWRYAFLNNGVFALQLLTVGSAGFGHAVVRSLDWLSDRRRRPVRVDVR